MWSTDPSPSVDGSGVLPWVEPRKTRIGLDLSSTRVAPAHLRSLGPRPSSIRVAPARLRPLGSHPSPNRLPPTAPLLPCPPLSRSSSAASPTTSTAADLNRHLSSSG